MPAPMALVEVWRGEFLESVHFGHAVIADASGGIVSSWGDPELLVLPRSSCKMIQALPLVESGADLSTERLALACASHDGAPMHVDRVRRWLHDLGLQDAALACGSQAPRRREDWEALVREGRPVERVHNNCSGKHTGFLQLAQRHGDVLDYAAAGHPVQVAVRAAFEDVTGRESPGWALDGCSAPNFATTLLGLARAMAVFAAAREVGTARERAAVRIREAMLAHPQLVAGEQRACTVLMRAMDGVVIKLGAEGVYTGILPDQRLGFALKIADGAERAAECAVASLLVRLGVLDAKTSAARAFLHAPVTDRKGAIAGEIRPAEGFPS